MAHRSDPFPESATIPSDPFARFRDIYLAFEERKTWTSDVAAFRLASVTLLTADGDAAQIVDRTDAIDAILQENAGFWNPLSPSTRLLVAASIYKNGDEAEAFWPAVDQTRSLFRTHRVRKGGVNEILAAMVFRNLRRGGAPTDDDVARFRSIFEELKGHHRWITNAADYPICAYLTTCPGTPKEIGDGTEAMYQALREHADLYRGDALQTAANVLFGSGLAPELAAGRAAQLITAVFRQRDRKLRQQDYDELALMVFLSLPVERIATLVGQYETRLLELRRSRWDSSWIFSIAVGLAFLHLLGQMDELDTLVDIKTVLDMQAIVAARAAATMAAVAAV